MVDEPRETKAQKREAARRRRIEEQRRRARAKRRKRTILAVGAAIVVLVLAVAGFQAVQKSGAKVREAAKAAGCDRITQQKDAGHQHIDDPGATRRDYTSKPPTSGDHYGRFIPPVDFYETNTMRPEQYVHGLEHGNVIIHHKGLPKEQVEELRAIQSRHKDSVIVLPNEEIDHNVVLSAWRYMERCDKVSELVIEEFIEERCNQGPEKLTPKC